MNRQDYIEQQIQFNGFYMYSYEPLHSDGRGACSTDSRPTYDDSYIDYWGQEYLSRSLSSYGIQFELFLAMPEAILAAIDEAYPDGHLPLLPAQQRVQRKIDLQTPLGELEGLKQHEALERDHQVVNRNGTFIERLKHHMWRRRRVA